METAQFWVWKCKYLLFSATDIFRSLFIYVWTLHLHPHPILDELLLLRDEK